MSRRSRGFTLIEMMVAVVIFLVFIGAVYGIYTAAHGAMARAEDVEEVTQTGRVLLDMLNTELTSVYQPASKTESQLLGEDGEEIDGVPQDRLTFLTTAHQVAGEQPVGDLCQVSYSMDSDQPDAEFGLYIAENLHPDLEVDTTEPEQRLLSPLVVGMNCRYLPAGGDDWVDEWVDQTSLPVAIRVELYLRAPRQKAPVLMVTTANLAMATAPAATTGGSDATP